MSLWWCDDCSLNNWTRHDPAIQGCRRWQSRLAWLHGGRWGCEVICWFKCAANWSLSTGIEKSRQWLTAQCGDGLKQVYTQRTFGSFVVQVKIYGWRCVACNISSIVNKWIRCSLAQRPIHRWMEVVHGGPMDESKQAIEFLPMGSNKEPENSHVFYRTDEKLLVTQ